MNAANDDTYLAAAHRLLDERTTETVVSGLRSVSWTLTREEGDRVHRAFSREARRREAAAARAAETKRARAEKLERARKSRAQCLARLEEAGGSKPHVPNDHGPAAAKRRFAAMQALMAESTSLLDD